MSIIQEALEKARSNVKPGPPSPKSIQVKKSETAGPSIESPLRKPVRQRAPDKRLSIALVLFVLVIAASLLAGRFLMMTGDRVNRTSAKNAQEVSYRPIVRDITKEPANAAGRPNVSPELIKKTMPPELILNGIMYLEGRPRAIINNLIVEQGDSVLGALVTGIKRESVVLQYENVEITLNLR